MCELCFNEAVFLKCSIELQANIHEIFKKTNFNLHSQLFLPLFKLFTHMKVLHKLPPNGIVLFPEISRDI